MPAAAAKRQAVSSRLKRRAAGGSLQKILAVSQSTPCRSQPLRTAALQSQPLGIGSYQAGFYPQILLKTLLFCRRRERTNRWKFHTARTPVPYDGLIPRVIRVHHREQHPENFPSLIPMARPDCDSFVPDDGG
jgi:hypothetical protein